ncbi:NAD(P)H-hydrate dehydratase [Adhaeretor mobilis]|uniref:ADP-dependent (S)-NAD(P)H-hydrate dehydratase n=1 Tax=Adhaeretor mobilis TaxID=1930276 RepID=A0A517N0Q4_9BACT|nr:NAD(P)H-hydrate dehydratase [Adhaeretor mobilis]QDT00694.1 ATP-dependent (S)-NAD(P)H-hydrate dehydratase [Adhaeretor mobilis]
MQNATDQPLPTLPQRDAAAHKGDFGRVLVIAGSRGMAGAAGLSGMAALRGGAGLVTVASPVGIQPTVATYSPCYTTIPLMEDEYGIVDLANVMELAGVREHYDAWAIGPGLGQSEGVTELVGQLYRDVPRPLVLDADGLNALAQLLERAPQLMDAPAGPRILTPHPGEFARLASSAAPHSQEDRIASAIDFAKKDSSGNTIVVLKGQGTVVADTQRYAVNETGNPGMATGGTGDCLTGVVAAFAAQGMHPWEAARLAVHVHGRAGDLAADKLGETSLVSSDLLDFLSLAMML